MSDHEIEPCHLCGAEHFNELIQDNAVLCHNCSPLALGFRYPECSRCKILGEETKWFRNSWGGGPYMCIHCRKEKGMDK